MQICNIEGMATAVNQIPRAVEGSYNGISSSMSALERCAPPVAALGADEPA